MSAEAGKLSISEAARTWKKDRTTIYRAIKKYNLSTEKSRDGQKTLIQFVDLCGALGEPANSDTRATAGQHVATPQQNTPNVTPFFPEKVSMLEKQVEDLREERNRLLGIVEKQTYLLEDKRTQQPKNTITPQVLWVFLPVCVIITAMPLIAWFLLNFLKP